MSRTQLEVFSGPTKEFFKDSHVIATMFTKSELIDRVRPYLGIRLAFTHRSEVSVATQDVVYTTLFNTGLKDADLLILDKDLLALIYFYYTKLDYFVTKGTQSGMSADQFFAPLIVIREHVRTATA